MRLTIVTPPTGRPITPETARRWAGLVSGGGSDVDALVSDMIDAAAGYYEQQTNRTLLTTVYDLELDADELADEIRIPVVPLSSVDSVVTIGTDDAETTMLPSAYDVRAGEAPRLRLRSGASWPATRDWTAARIRLTAGYGAGESDLPGHVRLALQALFAYFWANRGQGVMKSPAGGLHVVEIPSHVHGMLLSQKVDP